MLLAFKILESLQCICKLTCSYLQTDEGRKLFEIPLTINSDENIWCITKETIEVLPTSNHGEADTRLILHADMSNDAAVIVGKDTDMVLLLIQASGQLECFLPHGTCKLTLISSLTSR